MASQPPSALKYAIIDKKTSYLSLPLPHAENGLAEDCPRLAEALTSLDDHAGTVDSQMADVQTKLLPLDAEAMYDILDAKAKTLESTESGELSVSVSLVESMLLERSKREHPVGSYYTSDKDTEPAEIFGFGTWERVKGVVLLGADEDSYPAGSEGGEAEHTLTVEEMPPHTHGLMRYTGTDDQNWSGHLENGLCANDSPNYLAANTNATGGGKPHNNMMPYHAAYCWRRTA